MTKAKNSKKTLAKSGSDHSGKDSAKKQNSAEPLKGKRMKFVHEYVKDFNGAAAARRAGYSKHTAHEQAAQLLAILSVKAEVEKLQKLQQEKAGLTAAMVIEELRKVGFTNIRDFLDENNDVKSILTVDEAKAAAVSSIKVVEQQFGETTTRSTTFKLHDKISALEKLGKHLGIFEADNLQSGLGGAIIKITKKKK